MKNGKLTLLLLAATLALSIGYSQGCSGAKKSDPYISPESEIRLLVEGQTIRVINADNAETEWVAGKDYYVIHGDRLKELVEKVNRLEER
jgi:hypothetical protein